MEAVAKDPVKGLAGVAQNLRLPALRTATDWLLKGNNAVLKAAIASSTTATASRHRGFCYRGEGYRTAASSNPDDATARDEYKLDATVLDSARRGGVPGCGIIGRPDRDTFYICGGVPTQYKSRLPRASHSPPGPALWNGNKYSPHVISLALVLKVTESTQEPSGPSRKLSKIRYLQHNNYLTSRSKRADLRSTFSAAQRLPNQSFPHLPGYNFNTSGRRTLRRDLTLPAFTRPQPGQASGCFDVEADGTAGGEADFGAPGRHCCRGGVPPVVSETPGHGRSRRF